MQADPNREALARAMSPGAPPQVQIPLDQPLSKSQAVAEVGLSGYRRFAGRVVDEFLPELQGIRGVRVYEEMRRNDPVIGAMLRATVDVICALEWRADPPREHRDEPEAQKWAEFVEQCFEDMDHTRRDFLGDALTCIPFGWAVHEPVYKIRQGLQRNADVPDSQYDDGLIGFARIPLRKQQSLYQWVIAPNGRLMGMQQVPAPDYQLRTIPVTKMVLFKTAYEGGNPEGLAMLRSAYRPWYLKKNLEEVEAIGAERDLTGMPRIKLPWNATDSDKRVALDILARVHNDEQTGIVVPKGQNPDGHEDWEFDLLASPGSKAINTDLIIKRYAGEIATAFLAQFLRLGADGRGGSFALGSTMKDFFYLALTSIANMLEETINRFLVRQLLLFNGVPQELWPVYKHGRIAAREVVVFAEALKNLADAGLLGPVDAGFVNTLRQEFDLPEMPEDAEVEPPAPKVVAVPSPAGGQMPTDQPVDAAAGSTGVADQPVDAASGQVRQAHWYDLAEDDIGTWLTASDGVPAA
jgi:hypothetical protein